MFAAGEWISWGLGKGAEKAGVLMKKGSDLLQEKLKPEDKPSEIDPRAQQGVYYARQATGAAVKVSGFVGKCIGRINRLSSVYKSDGTIAKG